MSDVCLWPPLDDVRRSLSPAVDAITDVSAPACVSGEPADFSASRLNADLPEVLRALVERRAAVAALPQSRGWSSGDIVGLPGNNGVLLGVLLDEPKENRPSSDGRIWRGWLAAAEVDWAAAHDVVLEPEDEPFDPAVGVVQTWNRVEIVQTAAPPLGRLSAARLAAVRAVQDEAIAGRAFPLGAHESRPGQIGLRVVGGFTVLTGTPLGAADPRIDYQALYRAAAQRLASAVTPAEAAAPAQSAFESLRQAWRRLIQGWTGGVPARFLVAGSCVMVLGLVVHGWNLSPAPTPAADDEFRFRSMPAPQPRAVLSVRWRDAADAGDIAALLRGIGGELVGGPDAAGHWQVSVPDQTSAQRAMLASPLVAEVSSP